MHFVSPSPVASLYLVSLWRALAPSHPSVILPHIVGLWTLILFVWLCLCEPKGGKKVPFFNVQKVSLAEITFIRNRSTSLKG